jgi:small basic protein (TIGR04137 family)
MDRSLKSKASLSRHRNVLTRAERMKILEDEERWTPEKGIFGLPKVAHRKAAVGGKVKKAPKEGEEAAAGAAAAGTPPPAAAAPAKK